VWLFGDRGYDSAGNVGLLSDFWEYSPATKQWTWIGPSSSNVGNQKGSYGTLGQAQEPLLRVVASMATLWRCFRQSIWLFGGFGLDSAAQAHTEGAILNDSEVQHFN